MTKSISAKFFSLLISHLRETLQIAHIRPIWHLRQGKGHLDHENAARGFLERNSHHLRISGQISQVPGRLNLHNGILFGPGSAHRGCDRKADIAKVRRQTILHYLLECRHAFGGTVLGYLDVNRIIMMK